MTAAVPLPDAALVRVRDLAGRPRGAGFVADHHGTVVTSHEAVDGLPRLVLLTADDRTVEVAADAVTPLPEQDLALIRTEGLDAPPLPVTARDRVDAGTYVRLLAGCWREARVLASASVTYTATDRVHVVEDVLELAIGTAGRDALRLGGGAAGGPVLDARTGAVVGVVGTALRSGHSETGFAVPLRPATGPLADLLARNAATVPAYGADLGLAGVLELTATALGSDGPPGTLPGHPAAGRPDPVERPAVRNEVAAFLAGDTPVLALVGRPGSGRTTELAALAARRARGAEPAPTLWLRGADLEPADTSLADAARRALARAARVVAASHGTTPADLGDLGPDRLARLATASGRPLLLVLDGPEEMPPALRPADWTRATARWLEETGARLVLGCGPEYWEAAGTEFPRGMLHGGARHPVPHVPLPDLTPEEAALARTRHGIPDGALGDADTRHPLTLRLLSEVLTALPDGSCPPGPLDRDDVFAAHLDLMCLRVAVRLAAENRLRGTAVRRLAARVAGQVHEAARRSLGPGQGALDRETFEAGFAWGPAPARLGGGTGWASAVLTEGLLVPAGSGYRFAHQDLADWIQGLHLDLDGALHALVHRPRVQEEDDGPGSDPVPVPHHRIGPVTEALLHLARQHGPGALAERLRDLVHATDADPGGWWAPRLLAHTLRRVPDATPYTDVLRLLADRTAAVRGRCEGAGEGECDAADATDSADGIDVRPPSWPDAFGPAFWAGLRLPLETRLDLLRRLVLADPAPDTDAPRYLDGVAALLATAPTAVAAQLTRWFDDERPLPATPHATVARAAQALLHTHRHRALDDLTEVLADCAHRRADELLDALAEEEPSALCRAVDRWAHDERPARRVAVVTYGLRAAPHVRTDADRDLLCHAALALLSRPADAALHGGALGLLVRDPRTRARHLPQAVEHFLTGDPQLPPSALLAALDTHPEPVLDTVRARLRHRDADPGRLLCDLIEATAATAATAPTGATGVTGVVPALVRRVVGVVRDVLEERPEAAGEIAAYVDRRLDRPDEVPDVRPVLRPLVTGLLDGGPERVRATLAAVLTAPGAPRSRPLRTELRAFLLAHESEPSVLAAALHAAAPQEGPHVRDLVRRVGLLLVRTPEGAARFDRDVVDLGRHVPGFAARLAAWLTEEPQEWAAVVGPGTRRMIESLAGVRVPA
ncbi:hypothetical protein AQJ30_27170 [Streptomyces longwoodensis]|uniref:Large Pro/Ala/Gly-rich protein n=1 Tax=Streptomyces longwoodensis TaxID=68231 RepID=A0A101QSE1_9ACTN|nr:S1C family serine protease [Streptomyces longwoodensis]KUN35148.1 hypothetical protein AQJ30_27170 [Streptomyces longwoodensis]